MEPWCYTPATLRCYVVHRARRLFGSPSLGGARRSAKRAALATAATVALAYGFAFPPGASGQDLGPGQPPPGEHQALARAQNLVNADTDRHGASQDEELAGQRLEIERLRAELAAVRELAASLDHRVTTAQEDVRDVVPKMEVFLAAISVLLTVGVVFLGYLGWSDRKQIKENLDEARISKERLDAVMQEGEKFSKQMQVAISALEKVRTDLDSAFDRTPLAQVGVVQGAPKIDPQIMTVFEDCDSIVLICDRLALPFEPVKSVSQFSRLADFWQRAHQFSRALARLKRAQELSPYDPAIPAGAAMTWAAWAAVGRIKTAPDPDDVLAQRLRKALRELEAAEDAVTESNGSLVEERFDEKLLFIRAFIMDEQGDFDAAAQALTSARKLARKAGGREVRWDRDITYNLACTLARGKHLQEALLELRSVVYQDGNWKEAEEEPDFMSLREDSRWKEQFAEMIAGAKSRAERKP